MRVIQWKQTHAHYQEKNRIHTVIGVFRTFSHDVPERLRGLIGSALDHRSLPPEFESRRGHIWMVFHLWLRFVTFGGRSAHLAYHLRKDGRETPNITMTWWPIKVPSCIKRITDVSWSCELYDEIFQLSWISFLFGKKSDILECTIAHRTAQNDAIHVPTGI